MEKSYFDLEKRVEAQAQQAAPQQAQQQAAPQQAQQQAAPQQAPQPGMAANRQATQNVRQWINRYFQSDPELKSIMSNQRLRDAVMEFIEALVSNPAIARKLIYQVLPQLAKMVEQQQAAGG